MINITVAIAKMLNIKGSSKAIVPSLSRFKEKSVVPPYLPDAVSRIPFVL